MFNLIVGFTEGVADSSRMLEYTEEDVRLYVAPGGRVKPSRLFSLPTLVMPETGDLDKQQVAKIGRLTELSSRGVKVQYSFTVLHEISSEFIEADAEALGIDDFEFSRHHWAVKNADLYAVLGEHLGRAPRQADTGDHVAEMVAQLAEEVADTFLTTVGGSSTPTGWSSRPLSLRRLQVKEILKTLSPDQLDSLKLAVEEEFAQPEQPSPVTAGASTGGLTTTEAVEMAPAPVIESAHRPQPTVDPNGSIFVVHGHNHAALHLAVRVLERGTGRDVIVLHEQANSGRTVLEKFEQHATSAAFAVVLLTADDEGAEVGSPSHRKRARQNVIFELGFFFGQLGRERVVVLVDGGVEQPSDISGLVYIPLDGAGAWKMALGRELAAASIPVDYQRMP